MRATGIIRRIDDLGRVVIPKEIRRSMSIREGDPLEIYTEKGTICFRKYSPIGEIDTDTIKIVCDKSLGVGNYTIYDRDGEVVLPKSMVGSMRLNIDGKLDNNTCYINCDGDLIGYVQSPSGNKEVVADIIGGLLED